MTRIILSFFLMVFVFPPDAVTYAQEVTVIETGIEVAQKGNLPGFMHIELKEREIIQINRSLKKAIEENRRLQEKNKNLDRRVRSMRGQRNIEVNRMKSIITERNAYKQQNEQMSGLNRKFEKDVDELRARLQSREKQLGDRIRHLETRLVRKMEEIETMRKESPVSLAMGAVIEDQRRSLDLLHVIDELNQESEMFGAEKAKIHYNMGNIFFTQKKYKQAVKEYKAALRFKPHDPSTHFNLAFVSGEYMKDYQTAYKHYQRYLALNPEAEDAVLVQERMLEAELHLKIQIPDSSLERNPKFRSNFYK